MVTFPGRCEQGLFTQGEDQQQTRETIPHTSSSVSQHNWGYLLIWGTDERLLVGTWIKVTEKLTPVWVTKSCIPGAPWMIHRQCSWSVSSPAIVNAYITWRGGLWILWLSGTSWALDISFTSWFTASLLASRENPLIQRKYLHNISVLGRLR